MDTSLLFHILIAFGGLQAIFLSIVLCRRKNLATRLFAGFLAIEGFTLIERLLAETNLMTHFPHLLGVSHPLSFLKPPILFLVSVSIVNPHFHLRKIHLYHLLPFFLMVLLTLPFYFLTAEQKINQVALFINYIPEYGSFDFWFFLSFFLYIGTYLFLGIKKLTGYVTHIRTNKLANVYLKVLYLYSMLLCLLLLHFIFRPTGALEFRFVNEASMLLMTFLIQSIAYSFFTRSQLLEKASTKYIDDMSQLSKDGARIKTLLDSNKLFLDDTLSLDSLASSLGLSKKYVSNIINQSFGTTFKGLINRYRVEEAQLLMKDVKADRGQITQIGLRSGFNNKVSFYRAFKKQTGKSPTEYFQSIVKKV